MFFPYSEAKPGVKGHKKSRQKAAMKNKRVAVYKDYGMFGKMSSSTTSCSRRLNSRRAEVAY